MLSGAPETIEVETFFREFRASEFRMIDEGGLAYLDYTGAAIPAASQLRAHDELVHASVFGNPHSEHAPSASSTDAIEHARARVLQFLDADPGEYAVCFTANASAAAKLVAEGFPFSRGSQLALTADNHNSINGIRRFALRAGADVVTLPLTAGLRLNNPLDALATPRAARDHLFAFPAQSNFSGVRHPLSLAAEAQKLGYRVLLDAAAFVPSSALSLRAVHPDFVVLSFYKVFGFPTGVGALIARRDALALLERPWFAGGTVDWVSVQHGVHQLRESVEAFEDGTPNYLGIAALPAGFDVVERLRMSRIGEHMRMLTSDLISGLRDSAHSNGAPMFELYGPTDLCERGGTVAFNVRNRNSQVVPYELAEVWARDAGIAVRGGCFCNPGAAEAAFRFPGAESLRCLRAVSDGGFSPRRFAQCMGGDVAVGAVRASVGPATNKADVRRTIDALAEFACDDRVL